MRLAAYDPGTRLNRGQVAHVQEAGVSNDSTLRLAVVGRLDGGLPGLSNRWRARQCAGGCLAMCAYSTLSRKSMFFSTQATPFLDR